MVHKEAKHFMNFCSKKLKKYFKNKKVLDVGSGDINGNNRNLFTNCEYIGNDVCEAPNVTIVSKTKDLPFPDETFDTIISTECFEHDPECDYSFEKIYKMLKIGGIFIFTCASIGRPEHGTRRSDPNSSWGTISGKEDMEDYYQNLSEHDLREIFDLDNCFGCYDTYYNSISKDLYFIGIKGKLGITLPIYEANGVIRTTDKFIEYELM